MTRTTPPFDDLRDSQAREQDAPDNLVELPVVDGPMGPPGERLAQEPPCIGAWLEHADDPGLAERLAELAHELAEGPQPAAAPKRRRWPLFVAVAAAAGLLLTLAASAVWLRPAPRPAPPPIVQPILPLTVPTPAQPNIEAPVLAQPAPTPPPAVTPRPRKAPARLQPRTLVSNDPSQPLQLVDGVEVLLDGQLELSGSPRAPRVHLTGSAVVDVVPGSVDSFELTSAAARVLVLGTRFAVEEGSENTIVSVERGRVQARCQDGRQDTLEAGESLACDNANSLHMQALRLRIQGAPAEEVLAIVDAGLSFPDFALRQRLEVTRMELLLELERYDLARQDIQAYLLRDNAQHRADVERLAERLPTAP